MKNLFQVFKTLTQHPIGASQKAATLLRYFNWQVGSRLFSPTQIKPWVGSLNLAVRRGFHASTSCHYLGLSEFESMAFLLHLLRPDDVFVDAGANIGAYSLLASGVCGASSLAFEPASDAAAIFGQNIGLNKLQNLVQLHQIGGLVLRKGKPV